MDVTAPLLDERRLRIAVDAWELECAKRLRTRRLELGLSQTALAEAAGVRDTAISKFENAQVMPRDRVRVALAFALICEVSDIWPPMERAEAWASSRSLS